MYPLFRTCFQEICMNEYQKEAEKIGFRTLLENPRGLQKVLDTIVCGIVTIDLQGCITYSNDSARRMLALSREGLIGRRFDQAGIELLDITERTVPSDELPISRALHRGETVRGEVYALYNSQKECLYIVVNAIPLRDDQGEITGAVADFIDITGDIQKRREQEKMTVILRESETRYRQLTESAPVGVFECDGEGSWSYINPQWTAISGRTKGESLNFGWTEVIHPEDLQAVLEKWKLSARTRTTWHCEYRIVHPAGQSRWVRTLKSPVRFDGKFGSHFVGTVEDITARKETELALLQAKADAEEASQAKSRFLATVSHEIRTPMTVFMGMLELTLAGELDPQQRRYLDTALSSADSLLLLIEEILEFSELEADTLVLALERFDLVRCVQEALIPFADEAHQKGVDLRLDLATEVPKRVTGDERRLQCILRNLVGNAVKFTSEGWVVVEVSPCPDCLPGKESILFSVRDSGIGIESEKIDLLFRPFTQLDGTSTRTYGGAGLGLAICKGLVERMGGKIQVHTDPGAGSTFSFYLPLDAG
jgi:PAS domain S-box-containing protein